MTEGYLLGLIKLNLHRHPDIAHWSCFWKLQALNLFVLTAFCDRLNLWIWKSCEAKGILQILNQSTILLLFHEEVFKVNSERCFNIVTLWTIYYFVYNYVNCNIIAIFLSHWYFLWDVVCESLRDQEIFLNVNHIMQERKSPIIC